MPMFALLTRLSPEAVREPGQFEQLGREVEQRIHQQCPEAKWIGSYAVLGPVDYLDLFEAPNEQVASKVALLIRTFGHATTEMWTIQSYERFVSLVREVSGRAAA
ncbi:MAG: GYD domain-containing protein [Chloroflexi bacterium]|nr:GYD domain-containing protein [Chloroflexota bacterium]